MADRRYTINAFTVKLEPLPIGASNGTHPPDDDAGLERSVNDLLEFFEEFDVRTTFFTADAVTRSAPHLVRKIADNGHELAILAPRFHTPLDQLLRFREEIARAKVRLEQASGQDVLGFRSTPIHSGWRSPAMIETVVQEGFIYSSSTFSRQSIAPLLFNSRAKAHRLPTPSGTLWELPLTSWRPFGLGTPSIRTGGGPQLSLLPVWMFARGVEGMNRHGEPAILYVHSWALEAPAPDYSSLPLRERLLSYGPREETLEKLETIFRIYRFGSIQEAFASRLTTESVRPTQPRRTSIVRMDSE
jgi:hypothetical protein